MPYPPQITKESIINQAAILIEQNGVEALSLNKLATALGVKAPSLYRHIGNKHQLLQYVNLQTLQNLFAVMQAAISKVDSDPQIQMMALAQAYRQFAHEHPQLYTLAFTHKNEGLRPDEQLLTNMVLPIQSTMAKISGEKDSLAALRGALALLHGFVMLEINEQLQRGGDLDQAFTQSIGAYLHGWGTSSPI